MKMVYRLVLAWMFVGVVYAEEVGLRVGRGGGFSAESVSVSFLQDKFLRSIKYSREIGDHTDRLDENAIKKLDAIIKQVRKKSLSDDKLLRRLCDEGEALKKWVLTKPGVVREKGVVKDSVGGNVSEGGAIVDKMWREVLSKLE